MRPLVFIFLAVLFSAQLFSQDRFHKNGIGVKAFGIDFPSYYDSEIRDLDRWDLGVGIEYLRHVKGVFGLGAAFHFSEIDYRDENGSFILDENAFSVGLNARLKLFQHQRLVNADVFAGAAIFKAESIDMTYQVPVGVNVYFKVKPKWHVQLQTQMRWNQDKELGNLQAGIGVVHLLFDPIVYDLLEDPIPAADSDGDGVADPIDDCPTMAGLKELKGCPDSDGDMVSDIEDRCPNTPGVRNNNGCPKPSEVDTDGDGVENNEDECPDQAGLRRNKGCPDSDLDGVVDNNDLCPNDFGPKNTNGCPDTDGDGISDDKDLCPEIMAKTENGCPPIAKDDLDYLKRVASKISFQTGQSRLLDSSKEILDEIEIILNRYPGRLVYIEGHTDNTGSAEINQNLSEERAKSCYNYLVSKGVSPTRLRYAGYGEQNPIESNESASGRAANRRVEFRFEAY